MPEHPTILDVLNERARTTPDRTLFAELGRDGERSRLLSYRQLRAAALRFAETVAHQTPIDRPLIICAEPGLDFVVAFYACLYAGRIAVPAVLPRPERGDRLISIATHTRATHVVLSEQGLSRLADLAARSPSLARLTPVVVPVAPGDEVEATATGIDAIRAAPDANDVALLQYTSGSTGQTKGVVITHRNLMANSSIIADRFGHDEESRGLIWLPPYHDMGLIGGIVQPVFRGFFTTLMSPERFVMQPMLWLRSIAKFAITTSGGPNFAYELCAKRATPAALDGLDLSCWKVAFAGAERVRPGTMARFAETFAPAGFDASALLPCYGLAEATLYVAGRAKGAGVSLADVPLRGGGHTPSVSCGKPAPSLDLRFVDPETNVEVPVGDPGEIWLRGDSVSPGYWNAPAANATFDGRLAGEAGPFLRTGDMARLIDGELHVAGRIKAIIVVNGVNYQCEELEQIASAVDPDLARHAASLIQPLSPDGGEELILVQELTAGTPVERREALRAAIRQALSAAGIVLGDVVFVGPGRLPRTESGKVRRWRACELFVAGTLIEQVPQETLS